MEVFESRPFPGGRATSYTAPATGEEEPETIDNCQHILLRCCVNLLDFYTRLGVRDRIKKIDYRPPWRWHRKYERCRTCGDTRFAHHGGGQCYKCAGQITDAWQSPTCSFCGADRDLYLRFVGH